MSLGDKKVTAVVPVSDLSNSKHFYTEVLGLSKVEGMESESELVLQCGGDTTIQLYVSPTGAGASGATIATWSVDNIYAEMAELRAKGVMFEEYDQPDFQTEDGVYSDQSGLASWFKDYDGNILCLHETAQ